MLKTVLQKVNSAMKVNKNTFDFKDLLHNRVLLYVFLLISLVHLFYYVNIGDMRSAAIFILIGFLTSFFSKNMLVILIIALVVTHIMKFGLRSVSEGLENKEDEDKDEEKEETKEGLDEEEKEGLEGEEEEEEDKKEGMKEGKDKGTVPPKAKGAVKPADGKDLDGDKKKDYLEFQELQKEIMTNMQKLEPLITKAESFVEKYHEKYGSSNKKD